MSNTQLFKQLSHCQHFPTTLVTGHHSAQLCRCKGCNVRCLAAGSGAHVQNHERRLRQINKLPRLAMKRIKKHVCHHGRWQILQHHGNSARYFFHNVAHGRLPRARRLFQNDGQALGRRENVTAVALCRSYTHQDTATVSTTTTLG